MKVKVCGITNIEDALLSEHSGADALGFIFYNESKRYIPPAEVKKIIAKLSPFTMKIGVFVNESPELVNQIAVETGLNAVQLHGDEKLEYITKINLPVVKTIRIRNDFDESLLNQFNSYSILLDTYTSDEYGGTGKSFNWKLIPEKYLNRIILAGGISVDNVEFIFKNIKPAAIDISSSLEKEPGKKDEQKIKQFFNKLNSIRSQQNGNHDET